MKTIAITIEESVLQHIDGLLKAGKVNARSRSAIIRQAVRELVERVERQAEEEREQAIFRSHRRKLNRQAAALVREQADL